MKKTLALAAAMALVAAVAVASPNGNDKTCASAAGASMGGSCTKMSSAECAKMHCDGAAGASAMKMKMEHTTFAVAELKGQRDARKIQAVLASMKGVNDVSCDYAKGTATVCRTGASCTSAAVAQKLGALGYHATVVTADMKEEGGSCPYAKGAASGSCPHGKTSGASASTSPNKDKSL